jgi:hypothetical protein
MIDILNLESFEILKIIKNYCIFIFFLNRFLKKYN